MSTSTSTTYATWLESVDAAVWRRAGVSVHDLADAPLADWYEDGLRPSEAARAAIRNDLS